MNNWAEQLQMHIKQSAEQALDITLDDGQVTLERPKDESHGDYATNVALQLSKQLSKNPREIAQAIVDNLPEIEGVGSIDTAGPGFINIAIDIAYLSKIVDGVGETYGMSDRLQGKKYLIEHTSPNPNKGFHLGHWKNNVTGLAISYLWESQGVEVVRDCIDNNRGIAIAKLMWGYVVYGRVDGEQNDFDIEHWYKAREQWQVPHNQNSAHFMGQYYTLANDAYEFNDNYQEEMQQLARDWEAEDEKVWALWRITQEWVWEGYRESLERIDGWKFDQIWHEHEIYKEGKKHVERGLREGVFKELDDGAVLTDLKEEFGLSDTILRKNDGTALYITQDLELTHLKRKTFDPDEMFWVIGPEQSLAMKQMFAVCAQLGFGKYEDFHHIPYGFISIKTDDGQQKMSSRKGNVVLSDTLIDRAKDDLKEFISSELSADEIEDITEKVAIGAIKYSLLKPGRMQDMVFDYDTTIALEGNSGPYIMYTYSRARSIMRDASEVTGTKIVLEHQKEIDIARWLERYPEIVMRAADNYAPNYICEYVFELAQRFNKFYSELSVLNADTDEQKYSRLTLTEATAQVIQNALGLLGIDTVEKM